MSRFSSSFEYEAFVAAEKERIGKLLSKETKVSPVMNFTKTQVWKGNRSTKNMIEDQAFRGYYEYPRFPEPDVVQEPVVVEPIRLLNIRDCSNSVLSPISIMESAQMVPLCSNEFLELFFDTTSEYVPLCDPCDDTLFYDGGSRVWKSECHPFKLECPLVGGSNGFYRGRRRGGGFGRKSMRWKKNQKKNKKKNVPGKGRKVVTIGPNDIVKFTGKGGGVPLMSNVPVQITDTTGTYSNGILTYLSLSYQASPHVPIYGGGGSFISTGTNLEVNYNFSRPTAFSIDFYIRNLEAIPLDGMVYPYGPYNVSSYVGTNGCNQAAQYTLGSQRYASTFFLEPAGVTGDLVHFRKTYTYEHLCNGFGIDYRSDPNLRSITGSVPSLVAGLIIGCQTTSGAVMASHGVNLKAILTIHVDLFGPTNLL